MKIFITGAGGFVGSYTVQEAINRGHRAGYLKRETSDLWRIADMSALSISGDLREPGLYTEALKAWQPDVIVHLAWDGVGNKNRNDEKQLQNVPAAVALLKAGAAAGARHFIGLGSQAEYGPCENIISESQPTNPTTLYGQSKLAAMQQCEAAAKAAGIKFSWLRLFSSYGPKDSPDWVISYLTLKLLRREKPSLTACEQKWDFIHVRDVAAALVSVAETGAEGLFNLSSGSAPALKDTVTTLRDLVDPSLPLGIGEVPYRPDQVMHLEGDITRLKTLAHWAPKMKLEEGLKETVAWYRDNIARYA